VVGEHEVREEPRHHDALAELAERRLRPLAVRQRDRELREPRAGRRRQREAAAEARIDVGHLVAAVRLAEALHVRRPDDLEPRRAFTSSGHGGSSGTSVGSQVPGEWMPRSSKNWCARYLSLTRSTTSGCGSSTSAPSKSSRLYASSSWSRSVSGTTSRTSSSR